MDDNEKLQVLTQEVQRIVTESGDPTAFDAGEWLQRWITEPAPALGWRRPFDVMSDPAGFETVLTLLRRMQSGSYS